MEKRWSLKTEGLFISSRNSKGSIVSCFAFDYCFLCGFILFWFHFEKAIERLKINNKYFLDAFQYALKGGLFLFRVTTCCMIKSNELKAVGWKKHVKISFLSCSGGVKRLVSISWIFWTVYLILSRIRDILPQSFLLVEALLLHFFRDGIGRQRRFLFLPLLRS